MNLIDKLNWGHIEYFKGITNIKDITEADEKILEYMRERKEPVFFFRKEHRRVIAGTLRSIYAEQVQKVMIAAEAALQHKFSLLGNPADHPYLFVGEDIDWNSSPDGDREGLFALNRMKWWVDLAKAYWYSGEEKYIQEIVTQLRDWVKKCPAPKDGKAHLWDYSPWRALEAGIRIKNWLFAYNLILDSALWTADINSIFLNSIHDHCELLAEHVNTLNHNHTIMEMEGLLYGAVFFPGFKQSAQWLKIAVDTLEGCIREQVYEDGVHYEAIPSYHNGCIQWFAMPMYMAELNQIQFSKGYKELLFKMFDLSKYCHRPDGSCFPFGDSDCPNTNSRNKVCPIGYYLFDIKDLHRFAEMSEEIAWFVGLEGLKRGMDECDPGPASKAFPQGGYFCMQDSWHQEAVAALFRCGPMVHGHPHADLLSLQLFAYGKSLLGDVGKYTYNECTDRRYLKGTAAHNAIVVDGRDQAEYASRMHFVAVPEYKVNQWTVTGEYDFVDAEHYGFHRLPEPVTHRRQVLLIDHRFFIVIDRLTGKGEHDLEQFWHLDSNNAVMDMDTLAVETKDAGQPNIRVIPLVKEKVRVELFEGWISEEYGVKKPAKVIKYWWKNKLPISLVTLLIPEQAGKKAQYEIEECIIRDEAISIKAHLDGKGYEVTVDSGVSIRKMKA